MARFRKKSVVIEAFQLGIPLDEWPQWAKDRLGHRDEDNVVFSRDAEPIKIVLDKSGNYAEIRTLEGVMRADFGDWVIKGVKSEIYPCKPDIFIMTYEPTE